MPKFSKMILHLVVFCGTHQLLFKEENMKKATLLILSIMILLTTLVSCSEGENSSNQNAQNGNQKEEKEEAASVAIIFPDSDNAEVTDEFFKFYYELGDLIGTTPEFITESDAKRDREIVFGKSEREISATAYRLLERIELSYDDVVAGNPRVLIYSDGSSVAVAYEECEDDVAFLMAVKELHEKISSIYPTTKSGVLHSGIINLDKYYQSYLYGNTLHFPN